jgi:hypothetical protein
MYVMLVMYHMLVILVICNACYTCHVCHACHVPFHVMAYHVPSPDGIACHDRTCNNMQVEHMKPSY